MIKYKVIYKNVLYRVIEFECRPPFEFDYAKKETGIKKCGGFIGLLALNEDGELIHIVDETWMFQFVKEVSE